MDDLQWSSDASESRQRGAWLSPDTMRAWPHGLDWGDQTAKPVFGVAGLSSTNSGGKVSIGELRLRHREAH